MECCQNPLSTYKTLPNVDAVCGAYLLLVVKATFGLDNHRERCLLLHFVINHDCLFVDRLVGLVVKASASRAEDPGFESRLRRDFIGVESYQ